jgi:hypothetical protein
MKTNKITSVPCHVCGATDHVCGAMSDIKDCPNHEAMNLKESSGPHHKGKINVETKQVDYKNFKTKL